MKNEESSLLPVMLSESETSVSRYRYGLRYVDRSFALLRMTENLQVLKSLIFTPYIYPIHLPLCPFLQQKRPLDLEVFFISKFSVFFDFIFRLLLHPLLLRICILILDL